MGAAVMGGVGALVEGNHPIASVFVFCMIDGDCCSKTEQACVCGCGVYVCLCLCLYVFR